MKHGGVKGDGAVTQEVTSIRGNPRRIDLEGAVVQLPSTEKLIFLLHDVEGYDHRRIGRLLGITEGECTFGLHQARLRIRELVARQRLLKPTPEYSLGSNR